MLSFSLIDNFTEIFPKIYKEHLLAFFSVRRGFGGYICLVNPVVPTLPYFDSFCLDSFPEGFQMVPLFAMRNSTPHIVIDDPFEDAFCFDLSSDQILRKILLPT